MPGSLITAEWYSEALGRPTQINVILPPSLAAGTYQPGPISRDTNSKLCICCLGR